MMDRQFKQFDNINTKVVDDLRKTLQESRGCVVSIASASFSIYAFEALKEELEGIKELRFIFTSPTFIKDKFTKEKKEFFRHTCKVQGLTIRRFCRLCT